MVPMFTCGLLRSNFSFAMILILLDSDFLLRYFSLNFRHNFLRNIFRNLLVLPKVHRKSTAALGARSQLGGITEHFRQWHHGLDHLGGPVNFGAFQPSA